LKGYWRLSLAGAAAYLLFLLITVPADRVAGLLAQNTPGLELQSVTGTLLSGRAQRAVIHGLGMGPVSWSLRPLPLMMGRLEYRLDLQDPVIRGKGDVGSGLSGHVYLRDLRVALKPDPLVNHFSPVPVQTSGDVTLLIESLELVDGFPGELSGQLEWAGASIIEPVALSLGYVEASLHGESNNVVCRLTGTGQTALSGDFSLTKAGDYRLNLLLTPGAGVTTDIVDGLKAFGQARPGGAYLITDAGHL
jgi:general secretion pathway protein N